MLNYALVIPVLNGGALWQRAALQISKQKNRPSKVLVVDSGSTDGSLGVAQQYGFDVVQIEKKDFDHGGTRQMALLLLNEFQFVAYMTQDAVLDSESALYQLIEPFSDLDIAVVYGRQLPHLNANPIESHARLFNYPDQSILKTQESVKTLGLKAAFCSNSFAAYRRTSLMKVGGFPKRQIFAEDMYVAAKLLLEGEKIYYQADARCQHSHAYTLIEEFRRSFDIGVFHQQNPWLIEAFGSAEGEGRRFVLSQLCCLTRKACWLVPLSLMQVAIKYFGYRVGRNHLRLSNKIKSCLSLNRGYWMP